MSESESVDLMKCINQRLNETEARLGGGHTEDPRQTGRLAAHHLLVHVLLDQAAKDTLINLKTTIRRALRGKLLALQQTRNPEEQHCHDHHHPLSVSLDSDLGGFGEGLRAGLKEIEAIILERYPDDPHG